MKLRQIEIQKEYVRTIEKMGKELVLFKISAAYKRIGQNYHLYFEDKRKPPLNIAINPENGTIEYITYFAQKEKIILHNIVNIIDFKDKFAVIEEGLFDKNNTDVILEKRFKIIKSNNDIFIMDTEILNESLQAYKINDVNYLLFTSAGDFCGVLLKDISEEELNEIRSSQCL